MANERRSNRAAGVNNQVPCDVPLRVRFHDEKLVIEIGMRTLATCAESGPLWPSVKVLDPRAFAAAVAAELSGDEDESGMTPLMKALDAAMSNVVEDGSESVAYDEAAWQKLDDTAEQEEETS